MTSARDMAQASGEEGGAQALSVSSAMALAKSTLEGIVVKVVGEVSEVSAKRGYKAVYFTVKDESASMPCLMWNNRYRKQGVELAVGQLVEMVGRFTLYAAKGRMNFEALSITLAGEGDLRLRVANLARKLEAQGLMAPERKRPIPAFPETVGVVTSPRGAAVHDVLRTLRRRFPVAHVVLAGVPVEGAQAPAALMTGMRRVYDAGAEVILLVRGGGSYEDLMPFNDERLAITISRCPVPVVTGIGHEPDTSIADMVADLRASTPTAAAEAVSPSKESLENLFATQAAALSGGVERRIADARARVDRAQARPAFEDADWLLSGYGQGLDMAAERLGRAIPQNLARDRAVLTAAHARMKALLPRALDGARSQTAHAERALAPLAQRAVDAQEARTERLGERMASAGGHLLPPFEAQLARAASRLDDLSPLAVLARGYAMARDEGGAVVSHVAQVGAGDGLEVTVSDGVLSCEVRSTRVVETTEVLDIGGFAGEEGN